MKRILFILWLGSMAATAGAQEKVQEISSKIQQVRVFFQGSQITREADISLDAGTTTLVFMHLPASLNTSGITVSISNDVIIQTVQPTVNYLETAQQKEAKALNDSLKKVNLIIAQFDNQKFAYQQELELLMANKDITSNTGIDMGQLEEMQELYKKRIPFLKEEMLKLDVQKSNYQDKAKELSLQMESLKNNQGSSDYSVAVTVKTVKNYKGKLTISYIENQSYWRPKYDVRANDGLKNFVLGLKGEVYNGTKEDWENVKLIFSSVASGRSGIAPELTTNYLDVNKYMQNSMIMKRDSRSLGKFNGNKIDHSENDLKLELFDSTVPTWSGQTDQLSNISFELNTKASVQSLKQPKQFDIKQYTLQPIYTLYCAPKLDGSAYLKAQFVPDDEINRLDGDLQVFFDGNYVSNSHISPSVDDSMNVSLGMYPGVFGERKKLKEKSGHSFIGSKRKEERTIEITLKNSTKEQREVDLRDQIPVSNQKEIEVELLESNGAVLDENTGFLSWKLLLAPGESRKVTFSYRVTMPKSFRVTVD